MTQEPKKKRHYSWWSYIREIVREYNERNRTELSGVALRNNDAVESAIDNTIRMADGYSRLKLIRLLHWDRTHTLEGAALAIPCARSTAGKWQKEFFEEVARNRSLLD